MPEITLNSILITVGFNLLALLLLVRTQYAIPKLQKPHDKKRLPMSTFAYMIIGSNMFIFAYVWRDLIMNYLIVSDSALPLQATIGTMMGVILSLWMKNHLQWKIRCYQQIASKESEKPIVDLFHINARWHQVYFIQLITIIGGLLMILRFELIINYYVFILIAAIIAIFLHLTCQNWKNWLFQCFFSAIMMLNCLLTLNVLSFFIAIIISYGLSRVLLMKGIIKIKLV